MVKVMDFRIYGGSACRFDSRHWRFFSYIFYDDDGGAMRSDVGEHKARSSTCQNERSECRR